MTATPRSSLDSSYSTSSRVQIRFGMRQRSPQQNSPKRASHLGLCKPVEYCRQHLVSHS